MSQANKATQSDRLDEDSGPGFTDKGIARRRKEMRRLLMTTARYSIDCKFTCRDYRSHLPARISPGKARVRLIHLIAHCERMSSTLTDLCLGRDCLALSTSNFYDNCITAFDLCRRECERHGDPGLGRLKEALRLSVRACKALSRQAQSINPVSRPP